MKVSQKGISRPQTYGRTTKLISINGMYPNSYINKQVNNSLTMQTYSPKHYVKQTQQHYSKSPVSQSNIRISPYRIKEVIFLQNDMDKPIRKREIDIPEGLNPEVILQVNKRFESFESQMKTKFSRITERVIQLRDPKKPNQKYRKTTDNQNRSNQQNDRFKKAQTNNILVKDFNSKEIQTEELPLPIHSQFQEKNHQEQIMQKSATRKIFNKSEN